jgi:simple sugar transport system ATP-binding protein
MDEIIVQAKGITKYFPGVLANNHIDFELKKGEIHTLLGENGAGKSTLMNILDGIYHPDEGEIYIKGKKVHIQNPFDAMANSIGMIHQHFMLVDTLTVLENVALGLKSQGLYIDKKEISKQIETISKKYHFNINPYSKIWQLSVGEQQRVEIIKTLFRKAEILILDEPTAVLTPQESEDLFKILNQLLKEGKSIIFISHKLDEVMEISDRITVLRKGKVVGTVHKKDVTKGYLAKMMVGREVLFSLERKPLKRRGEVLKVKELEAYNDKGFKALKKISFSVFGGEIFGIAGISGNGQKILAQTITGLRLSQD